MTVRNDEEAQCIPWATKEEIALYKGWVRVSEYSVVAEDNEEEKVKEVQTIMGSGKSEEESDGIIDIVIIWKCGIFLGFS
ncbi:hypothetical protein Tco_0949525 [Tanacetum coccineum]